METDVSQNIDPCWFRILEEEVRKNKMNIISQLCMENR